jgi:hypothetical protein
MTTADSIRKHEVLTTEIVANTDMWKTNGNREDAASCASRRDAWESLRRIVTAVSDGARTPLRRRSGERFSGRRSAGIHHVTQPAGVMAFPRLGLSIDSQQSDCKRKTGDVRQ